MKLVTPSLQRAKSFEEAIRECSSEEQRFEFGTPGDISVLDYGIQRYIEELPLYAQWKNLPQGRVAQTTYRLIENDSFIWQIKRRHELNAYLTTFGGHIGYVIRPSKRRQWYGTKILALGLEQWKQEWIKQVLITCNQSNIGSKKIIEANGGVYMSKIRSDHEHDMKLRYRIYL